MLPWKKGPKNDLQFLLAQCLIICFLIISSTFKAAGQQKVLDWTEYFAMVRKADSLYTLGDYSQALRQYSLAFQYNSGGYSVGDKYKVARAWGRVGNKDSAIFALRQEIKLGYSKLNELRKEPAFIRLHGEKEWEQLLEAVAYNEQQLGKYKRIKDRLAEVFVLDQKYRNKFQSVIDSFGFNSREMKHLQRKMKKADAKNLKYVSNLIDKFGWISYDSIGVEGSNVLFMVIQHADSITQEKYLPLMQNAVKQNKALANQLAMLEDRVLLRRGLKQIYGTQVFWDDVAKKWLLSPIEDEKDVDKRRAQVGLQPIRDYLKYFGIDYPGK
jgi:tetratricopeptide (TPR) repeat protein